ncbi:MAG: hypothetical protein SVR04_11780 [Spirochaetota bacterium]|nr:hypothetical protein [Spirochaetota bacterium]
MCDILHCVAIVFGNEEDPWDALQIRGGQADVCSGKFEIECYPELACYIIGLFSNGCKVAVTMRESLSARQNNGVAMICDAADRGYVFLLGLHIFSALFAIDTAGRCSPTHRCSSLFTPARDTVNTMHRDKEEITENKTDLASSETNTYQKGIICSEHAAPSQSNLMQYTIAAVEGRWPVVLAVQFGFGDILTAIDISVIVGTTSGKNSDFIA